LTDEHPLIFLLGDRLSGCVDPPFPAIALADYHQRGSEISAIGAMGMPQQSKMILLSIPHRRKPKLPAITEMAIPRGSKMKLPTIAERRNPQG
jgi:hypothetical protein